MQYSDTFSVKFSVSKYFTSATVFNIKSPNFHLLSPFLDFTVSANIRFSIDSRSVRRVYCIITVKALSNFGERRGSVGGGGAI